MIVLQVKCPQLSKPEATYINIQHKQQAKSGKLSTELYSLHAF